MISRSLEAVDHARYFFFFFFFFCRFSGYEENLLPSIREWGQWRFWRRIMTNQNSVGLAHLVVEERDNTWRVNRSEN